MVISGIYYRQNYSIQLFIWLGGGRPNGEFHRLYVCLE